ncbi:hypothetical protein C0J52_26741 [Blattella germanica]|nr:hypothetical protein C0J52_26741 [Blattella germanica]
MVISMRSDSDDVTCLQPIPKRPEPERNDLLKHDLIANCEEIISSLNDSGYSTEDRRARQKHQVEPNQNQLSPRNSPFRSNKKPPSAPTGKQVYSLFDVPTRQSAQAKKGNKKSTESILEALKNYGAIRKEADPVVNTLSTRARAFSTTEADEGGFATAHSGMLSDDDSSRHLVGVQRRRSTASSSILPIEGAFCRRRKCPKRRRCPARGQPVCPRLQDEDKPSPQFSVPITHNTLLGPTLDDAIVTAICSSCIKGDKYWNKIKNSLRGACQREDNKSKCICDPKRTATNLGGEPETPRIEGCNCSSSARRVCVCGSLKEKRGCICGADKEDACLLPPGLIQMRDILGPTLDDSVLGWLDFFKGKCEEKKDLPCWLREECAEQVKPGDDVRHRILGNLAELLQTKEELGEQKRMCATMGPPHVDSVCDEPQNVYTVLAQTRPVNNCPSFLCADSTSSGSDECPPGCACARYTCSEACRAECASDLESRACSDDFMATCAEKPFAPVAEEAFVPDEGLELTMEQLPVRDEYTAVTPSLFGLRNTSTSMNQDENTSTSMDRAVAADRATSTSRLAPAGSDKFTQIKCPCLKDAATSITPSHERLMQTSELQPWCPSEGDRRSPKSELQPWCPSEGDRRSPKSELQPWCPSEGDRRSPKGRRIIFCQGNRQNVRHRQCRGLGPVREIEPSCHEFTSEFCGLHHNAETSEDEKASTTCSRRCIKYRRSLPSISKWNAGNCSPPAQITKVLWAVTRINVFQDNSKTYEVMAASEEPPPLIPHKSEGVFVVIPN